MKLYKYLSPERVDVLEQSLIRFTPAALFNDPFDSAFAIDVLEEHVTDWVDDRIQHIVEDLYAKNSEVADRDELLEMADRHRAKTIEQQIRMRRSFTEQVRPLVHTMFAESLGVLSLTEVPDNLLMWAHYAAHHRGFLVGFDADHQWFKQMRPEDSSGRSALRRVSYTRERPVGELSKFNIETMLLTKSLDWQYEREWRAIRGLDAAADVVHLSTEGAFVSVSRLGGFDGHSWIAHNG